TGAGSFNLILGGVQASSGEIPRNQFQLGTFSLAAPAPTGTSNSTGVLGTSVKPSTGGTAAAAPTASNPPAANAATITPAASIASKGKRGGALADGDRRKMRRAQREIPQFTV